MDTQEVYDVIVIGAGAAGIGLGVIFEKMGLENYVIFEKDTIASSFKNWPDYTRFISPSFTGNFFNAVDLNAVTPDTSPAYNLKTEHPSGKLYAEYLELVADHFEVRIQEHTPVTKIEKQDALFLVHTPKKVFQAKFVVWAGGEFHYPATASIPGAEYCIHSSHVHEVNDANATIIGGYESGMELAIHLLEQGKDVTIIDRGEPWEVDVSDSSISLAPHTRDRLRPYIGSTRLRLMGNTEITRITQESDGYTLHTKASGPTTIATVPILATGFAALPPVVAEHFSYADDHVALTENDESTETENMFLIGPKVQHGEAIFCFIYKFRQRLPIVAEAIAERLGVNNDAIGEYKASGMYLKDLSCCGDECPC